MRAPTIPPKKCSTVKVDGSEEGHTVRTKQQNCPMQATVETEKDTNRDEQQNSPRQVTEEMDTGENEGLGVGRFVATQAGVTVDVYGNGDVIGLDDGMGNFDDTLKEIDAALNVLDGTNDASFGLKAVGLDNEQAGGTSMGKEVGAEDNSDGGQEDHGAISDNSTSIGGSLRGWKRLARDKSGGVQRSSSSGGKRHFEDCLEGMVDLVPTKRHCASGKNNETVEAEAQPRRAQ